MAYFNSFINEPQRELSKKDEVIWNLMDTINSTL
jgi:hypothetical protein